MTPGTLAAAAPPAPSGAGAATLRVSVVVPTYRRPALLDRCLAALAAQTLDPAAYEIVVADDAAEAEARRVAAAWAARAPAPVRYVPVTGAHGPAAARNAGWRAAAGDVVAFTDDDCLPAPGWLAAGLAAFGDGVVGVWGRLVVPRPPRPTDYERTVGWLEGGEFLTANCFYRREALAAAGGFDERFRLAWREDSDLYYTLLARPGRFVRSEAAVVVHPVRPARWGVSLREQRKSLYNALLYKKHPRLYRDRIQRRPPWRYYAILLALVAGPAAWAAGAPAAATAAAGLWAALTGWFCAERLRGTSRAPAHVAEMVVTSALIPPLAVYWRLRGAWRYRVWFL